MKFYEFNTSDFPYYALIGAVNVEDAEKNYVDEVSDIDNKDAKPVEVTKEYTIEKIKKSESDEDESDDDFLTEFEESIKSDDPYLILIDGNLT